MKTIFAKLSAAAIGAALFTPAYAVDPLPGTQVSISVHDKQTTLAAKFTDARDNRGLNLQTWDVATPDGSTFLALCVEPGKPMYTGSQTYTSSTFSFGDATAERQEQIGRLYGMYYDQITASTEASKDLSLSFQLALWELYNDDATFETNATGKIALNNTVSGNRGNGVGDYAGADVIVSNAGLMLAAAKNSENTFTQTYTFTRYTSGSAQDFVIAKAVPTVSPVPEPSTYAMLGLGLALVGFTARRKSKR